MLKCRFWYSRSRGSMKFCILTNFQVMLRLLIQWHTWNSNILNQRGKEKKGEDGCMTWEAWAPCPHQFNENLSGYILNTGIFKEFSQVIQIYIIRIENHWPKDALITSNVHFSVVSVGEPGHIFLVLQNPTVLLLLTAEFLKECPWTTCIRITGVLFINTCSQACPQMDWVRIFAASARESDWKSLQVFCMQNEVWEILAYKVKSNLFSLVVRSL